MSFDPSSMKLTADDVEAVFCAACGSGQYIQVFQAVKPKFPALLKVPEEMVFASQPQMICMGCQAPMGITKEEAQKMRDFIEQFNTEAAAAVEGLDPENSTEEEIQAAIHGAAARASAPLLESENKNAISGPAVTSVGNLESKSNIITADFKRKE